jgi:hypothetical protein
MKPATVGCLAAFLLLAGCTRTPVTVADTPTDARAAGGGYIGWKEHLIDDEEMGSIPIRGATRLLKADLDKDGHPDILSVHRESNHVRMAFGSADPDEWTLLSLVEGKEVADPRDIAVADLNGDGYPDVLAACGKGHLLYLQSPGGTVRGWVWKRVIPTVTEGRGAFVRVFVADLNKDGRPVVVAAYEDTRSGEGVVSWFEVPADPLDAAGWREHILAKTGNRVDAEPIDLDGDGDTDILVVSAGDSRIFWLENLGGKELRFKERPIQAAGPSFQLGGPNVALADLNGDGRPDVILCTSTKSVLWLEQPSNRADPWKTHLIGSLAPDQPVGLSVADINGDKKPDLMVGTAGPVPKSEDNPNPEAKPNPSEPAGRLAWFENPGSPEGSWKRHDICRRQNGAFDAFVPWDMNGDGAVDFAGTRSRSGKYDGVYWLQQSRTKRPAKAFRPAREKGSPELPLPPG